MHFMMLRLLLLKQTILASSRELRSIGLHQYGFIFTASLFRPCVGLISQVNNLGQAVRIHERKTMHVGGTSMVSHGMLTYLDGFLVGY